MNDKQNKHDKIEQDSMNIKSHLNTSFEDNGISVTEELINRTLEAIKKQAEVQTSDQDTITLVKGTDNVEQDAVNSEQDTIDSEQDTLNSKEKKEKVTSLTEKNSRRKKIRYFTRSFAAVAAAVIVVVGGYQILRSGTSKMDKSSNNFTAYDTAANEAATADTEEKTFGVMSAAGDEGTAGESAKQVTPEEALKGSVSDDADSSGNDGGNSTDSSGVSDQFTGAEDDSDSADNNMKTDIAGDTENSEPSKEGSGETSGSEGSTPPAGSTFTQGITVTAQNILEFKDIVQVEPSAAKKIIIINPAEKTEITLSTDQEVEDFFTMMGQQQFTGATEGASDIQYTIKIASDQGDNEYQMDIGNHITVDNTQYIVTGHSFYDAADMDGLLQSLQEFSRKYLK